MRECGSSSPLDDRARDAIVAKAMYHVQQRVAQQGGVPSYHDNYLRALAKAAETSTLDADPTSERAKAEEELSRFLAFVSRVRYEDPVSRLSRSEAAVRACMGIAWPAYKASQGLGAILHWAARPIFKTVYDLATYPMLMAELRPRTIIELGSGSGGSAIWLADVAQCHGLAPTILSLDRKPVAARDDRVRFVTGDILAIDDLLPAAVTARLDHPWLVLEDAHAHLPAVLRYFDDRLVAGDYLIIEDSLPKRADLLCFVRESSNHYQLDTRYLDFFGENTTSAIDAIFVRHE